MKKKIFKIVGILFLLIVGLIIAAPFILEAKIGDLIKTNVNNNLNAHLDFTDASLSLVKSFPDADLRLQNVTLINKAPFEGDTLFAAKDMLLTMGVKELLKDAGEAIAIQNINVDGAKVHVQVNEEELASYEIGPKNDAPEGAATDANGFTLDLQSYEIKNSEVIYDDQAAKIYLVVSDIQHRGTGDLSAVASELNTNTEASVTFALDSGR